MWRDLNSHLKQEMARAIQARFGVEHDPVLEVPPRRELGDLAFPAALQLARTLKKNPKAIAEELQAEFRLPSGVRDIRILGAGYLNLFLDRPAFVARLLDAPILSGTSRTEKVIVEHTNINPNKAAHIGHLRNAVLGDVLGRSLRALGFPTEVQNYIDDTGVQVADVVVGFLDLRGVTLAEVAALPEPFDFYCWDLYSEVGRWFGEDPARQALRRATLHELESGEGPRAEMGRLIARRIVGRHLATMARLGIGYDLLTHESDILALHFFNVAFERLKVSGAVRLEADGKNVGCWVMPLSESDEFSGLEDPDKVIVRSDGTVTYVGKDIAYQLWKFGLLGQDFEYRLWTEQNLWQTCHEGGVTEHPPFGGASRVINVIDNRQSYLQKIVRAGLQSLGHGEEAKRSVHFAYEMVALSPATARLLGFAVEGEEKALEMSGRKGIGVKADDLIDQLQAKSREEIASRNRELDPATLDTLAHQIAVAAIRFFMVKATTNRVIAFDFDEALSFEGESGPYLQYSLVRAKNIRRRLVDAGLAAEVSAGEAAEIPAEAYADDLWDLALATAQVEEAIERGALGLELSIIARQALDLAQKFNQAYHKHPILHETDETLRTARLAAVQVYQKGLETLADVLGVPVPDKM